VIAYGSASGVTLIAPDGAPAKFQALIADFKNDIAWSGDAKWLMASEFFPHDWALIEMATGVTLPLPFTTAYSWFSFVR
jgi:hypothetical protein